MNGILTIAHLTFHEARRRKILFAALLLGLAFLAVFATGFWFLNDNVSTSPRVNHVARSLALNFAVMAGLYAVNFLTVMTAVLVPIDTLSGEIESGVLQTLATKPISRWQILLGKWLGFATVLFLYLALMAGGVLAVARVISGFTPPGVQIGIPLMAMEGLVLLTISFAGGTRLSTLANGVLGFGLYGLAFIGGWMEQLGTLLGSTTARDVGVVASLLVPSESLWQLAAWHMQPSIMRDVNLTPFSPASVPSTAMIVWAACYVLATLAFALRQISRRDL
jgi:ABC-type transport system involved in multi-copper enzyme maturation permease subunit